MRIRSESFLNDWKRGLSLQQAGQIAGGHLCYHTGQHSLKIRSTQGKAENRDGRKCGTEKEMGWMSGERRQV